MKKLLLPVLIVILSFISCDKNGGLKKELRNFTGSQITIPAFDTGIFGGKDTIGDLASAALCTMVIFYDSDECASCRISRLWEWQQVVDLSKATNQRFMPLFIFSPEENGVSQLKNSLSIHPLECMIYIDTDQSFLKTNNHVPADKRLHTFLLDKEGKIILVGNPVNNNELWTLYKSTVGEVINNGGTLPL